MRLERNGFYNLLLSSEYRMIYVGYNFTLDEDGLHISDAQNKNNIKMSELTKRHGWNAGDNFTLTTTPEGYVLLRKSEKDT